jgi:hypothetical protein
MEKRQRQREKDREGRDREKKTEKAETDRKRQRQRVGHMQGMGGPTCLIYKCGGPRPPHPQQQQKKRVPVIYFN